MRDFDLIVAVARNGVIGDSKTNDMPWHIPRDLKHFRDTTMGKTVVMGNRTWESLPVKPLRGRRNVIISRSRCDLDGDAQYDSLAHALVCEKDVIVIGGGQVYREAMLLLPRTIHATVVHMHADGDVTFPLTGLQLLAAHTINWHGQVYRQRGTYEFTDEGYAATFVTLDRVGP